MITELVKTENIGSTFKILSVELAEIRNAVAANIGQSGLSIRDFEHIKMPAGGGTAWTVQGLDGEEVVKELTGIIVGHRDTRRYWSVPMEVSDGRTPPDCYSMDATTGIGNPGGECSKCPLAQFGSGSRGTGQACKQVRELFIIRAENLLPEIVNLPPASVSSAQQYLTRLASKGMPCYSVLTKLTLEKTKNSQGIVYSRAVVTLGGRLTPEAAERAKQYAAMIAPFLRSTPVLTTAHPLVAITDGEVV